MYIYILLILINLLIYKKLLELINILDYKIENDLIVKIENQQTYNRQISSSDDILYKKRSHIKPSSGSLFYADKVIKNHTKPASEGVR
tara:strand:- start:23724 stop:23987 length:264 start_codon:yes stop_codon:yes gene_type:complete